MAEVMINEDLQEKLNTLIQETVMEEGKSEEDLNFFHDNNASQKRKTKKKRNTSLKPHNTTRIKTRKFLTNIFYHGVTEEDFYNKSFVFDIYVLLTKKLNLFLIE